MQNDYNGKDNLKDVKAKTLGLVNLTTDGRHRKLKTGFSVEVMILGGWKKSDFISFL